MKIADFLPRTLEANGVRHLFGNPGTTEIPLVRACEQRRDLQYIVALSEVAAVPMADGYARATRSLGVVNLHVAPGLGNGMGNLYTAAVAGTPLLVLIGGQDRRFVHTYPILWGPLEKMAGAVCKNVYALNTRYDAAANIRRALRSALTPPYAPVALICPPDLLEQNIEGTPAAVHAPCLAGLGAGEAKCYAAFLTGAKHPALIAGEDVHWSDAGKALQRLAGAIGALVYVAPYTGVLPVASTDGSYAGYLPPSLKQIAERLAGHDALLFVGGRGFRTTLYSEGRLPQRKAWLGHDASVMAPEGEFELAYTADPRSALMAIGRELRKITTGRRPEPVSTASIELPPPGKALHPTRAVHALLQQFRDALWVDESGLSTSDVRQWMKVAAGDYLINGSGGIGWGIAAMVGAAVGCPKRPIVALVGDGSALYAAEALWTAAHHGTKILLVIFSNRRYATLNAAARKLAGGGLASFTIEPPVMDFGGLARLYGWDYVQAAREGELSSFLAVTPRRMDRNTLLELKLDPALKPATASRHF